MMLTMGDSDLDDDEFARDDDDGAGGMGRPGRRSRSGRGNTDSFEDGVAVFLDEMPSGLAGGSLPHAGVRRGRDARVAMDGFGFPTEEEVDSSEFRL